MTESPWTAVTFHSRDESVTVHVQADSAQDAAAALNPFVAPDVIFSGPYTTRTQAVEAILQERRIAAAAELERAQLAYQRTIADLDRLHAETETEYPDPEYPDPEDQEPIQ